MANPLQGVIFIPGDKSLSHRALIFSALAGNPSYISGLLDSADVQATRSCLEQLGAVIRTDGSGLRINPPAKLTEPNDVLFVDNAGTSIRLLTGLLAAQPFFSVLTGDPAIRRRPMGRVVEPLTRMGAKITGRQSGRLAPLAISPPEKLLHGIRYDAPIASAQVKSAVLLAGLHADTPTTYTEPVASRDHTERLLTALGVQLIRENPLSVTLAPAQIDVIRQQRGWDWQIPGDMSSAAFFMVAATLIPGSNICLPSVGLNPGRMGLLSVLQQAGANIRIENARSVMGEPIGDLIIRSSPLQGDISLTAADIPALVDEIPILTVAGLYLDGTLRVRGAEELRTKESDRLAGMQHLLENLGITGYTPLPDGFDLTGRPDRPIRMPQTALDTCYDHRLAMSMAVLNRMADPNNEWPLLGREWVNVSFPGFYEAFDQAQGIKAS